MTSDMTPERWQQIEAVVEAALERGGPARAAFLDEACAGDTALRREVESLLVHDGPAVSFMEGTPVGATEWLGEEPADAQIGRPIGPYHILREIGHGGMGTVYLAERADGQFAKQVAIKLVQRGMDCAAIIHRFRNEQRILARLDHPNIVRLLDGGTTEDGLSYFIMDYVEGLPIDVYCDTHKLPTVERLKLLRTVCSAVHYAHERQIVHRDLKPSNILVTAEGAPKLLDFGIARLLDPESFAAITGPTGAGLRPMTPEYASPEQVRGSPITPASDVYSLGVVLYELLTGHRPYRLRAHTPQETERVICENEPMKPSTVISLIEEVPAANGTRRLTPESVSATRDGRPEKLAHRLAGDLDNIVMMALRKEPGRRYASAEQLAEDIRRHLEGRPVLARRDTLWYRGAKFVRRNKAAVLAAAGTALILALLAVGAYFFTARGRIDSLAVLPFANVGANPETEYLSDGITETLMDHLSRLPRLKVLPRSTAFRYKGREQDPQAIGRALGVQALMTGRVWPQGDNFAVRAELVDVQSRRHLWGDQYTRKLSDLVALPEEIARQVADRLGTRLTGEEKQRLTKRYTEDTEAYQAYLNGRYFWHKGTENGLRRAVECFERAVEKDPAYAVAYAGLAEAYLRLEAYGTSHPKELMPKAKAATLKALARDDTLAEAHTASGQVIFRFEWNWQEAERAFQRALALNPRYAHAHFSYGHFLVAMGRRESAVAELKRAQDLDPFSVITSASVASILSYAGQYDEAIEQARKTIEMDPNYPGGYRELGMAYEQKGMYEDAIAAFEQAVELSGARRAIANLGYAYAASGKRKEAERAIDQLKELFQQSYASPCRIAEIYAGLGEKDQAFAWLNRAYEERDGLLRWLKVNPRFHSLRADPRFADLLRRMGLTPKS